MPEPITITLSETTWEKSGWNLNAPVWRVVEGQSTCPHCQHRVYVRDCAMAVFAGVLVGTDELPVNMTCPECRGLLYPTKSDDLLPG